MAQQPKYDAETQILHGVVTNPNCRWWWTTHALERMHPSQRDINAEDVKHVLTNGHVVLVETAKRDILWRVIGRDIDGRRIEVVVAVFEDEIRVKVVTVF